jgi:starch synthase
MEDLRVLICSSEAAPYAKTGGLADVSAALPEALQQLGCDVRLFLPLHRCVREVAGPMRLRAGGIPLEIGARSYHGNLWEATSASGIPVYFLEKPEFFDRTGLYGTPDGDYEDNADRFIAFSQAVLPLCKHLGWFPSILHSHDWQAALVSAYWFHQWRYDPDFALSGTVFTIHNLAYQGIFPASHFALTHLPPHAFSVDGMEFWDNCSFLKAGLVFSDFLTTVSPRYSQEIQTPDLGCGLDGVLRNRRSDLTGILNGVDYLVWDPATDPYIPAHYSGVCPGGKKLCKERLLAELGFSKTSTNHPLLGMINRLVPQKGVDLLRDTLDDLLALNVTMAVLGAGDAETQAWLQAKADQFPGKLQVRFGFDEGLAHKIEAGADIFLMPSHFEPCGLNQMYSLRYGTIPVVHATGGLDDSIVDVMLNPQTGTGFKFYQYTPFDFLYTTRCALELYQQTEAWSQLQRRAMAEDFSWQRSARSYRQIYQQVLERRRPAF